MQKTMQSNCAVFRSGEILQEGVEQISEVYTLLPQLDVRDRGMIWNTDLVDALELDNLVCQAASTVNSAVNRKESRGAHARENFTELDDDTWMKHTLAWVDSKGKVKINYRPVHEFTMTDEIVYTAPKARVY